MALKQGKSEKFNEYLRALGNLKALHGAANDDELFKKLSFAERQALFALLDPDPSDADYGEFCEKILKNDLKEYEESYENSKGVDRGLYEKVSFDDAVAFFGILNSGSPDSDLFKKNIFEKIGQQSYTPSGTEFGAEVILEIGAGMVVGSVANMLIRNAFKGAAVALFGPTLAASIVVGAVAGAAVGTMFGTYYAYKNLPEKEKAKTLSEYPNAIIHAFEKNAVFIMKRAAIGALLGAGSGMFGWFITGGANVQVDAPSQNQIVAETTPEATGATDTLPSEATDKTVIVDNCSACEHAAKTVTKTYVVTVTTQEACYPYSGVTTTVVRGPDGIIHTVETHLTGSTDPHHCGSNSDSLCGRNNSDLCCDNKINHYNDSCNGDHPKRGGYGDHPKRGGYGNHPKRGGYGDGPHRGSRGHERLFSQMRI